MGDGTGRDRTEPLAMAWDFLEHWLDELSSGAAEARLPAFLDAAEGLRARMADLARTGRTT